MKSRVLSTAAATVAVAGLLVPATVPAATTVTPLTLPQAAKVANKVRHREARNVFHLRARIGGPFTLGHTYCEQGSTLTRAICHYDAAGTTVDANQMRMRCSIDITVRRSGRRVTWRRRVTACARQA